MDIFHFVPILTMQLFILCLKNKGRIGREKGLEQKSHFDKCIYPSFFPAAFGSEVFSNNVTFRD